MVRRRSFVVGKHSVWRNGSWEVLHLLDDRRSQNNRGYYGNTGCLLPGRACVCVIDFLLLFSFAENSLQNTLLCSAAYKFSIYSDFYNMKSDCVISHYPVLLRERESFFSSLKYFLFLSRVRFNRPSCPPYARKTGFHRRRSST